MVLTSAKTSQTSATEQKAEESLISSFLRGRRFRRKPSAKRVAGTAAMGRRSEYSLNATATRRGTAVIGPMYSSIPPSSANTVEKYRMRPIVRQ